MGKILQNYYSKNVFFVFVVVFEVGSLICALAPTSTAFIVGRAIAGIGGAGLFNGGLAIVAASSTKEQRPGKNSSPQVDSGQCVMIHCIE